MGVAGVNEFLNPDWSVTDSTLEQRAIANRAIPNPSMPSSSPEAGWESPTPDHSGSSQGVESGVKSSSDMGRGQTHAVSSSFTPPNYRLQRVKKNDWKWLDFHLFLNRINLKGNSERQLKEKNTLKLSPNRENKCGIIRSTKKTEETSQ